MKETDEKDLTGHTPGKPKDTRDDRPAGESPLCPHCNQPMKRWKTPPLTNWESPWVWVCFNDECGYYKRGWDWMLEKFNVKSSYRWKIDPFSGESGPLPVWSENAMKSGILPDDEES